MVNSGFAQCLYRGLSLSFKAQSLPQIEGGFVSGWVSCCCTDTGLLTGMHLG